MADNTRVLGIDPGLNVTGYAVLERSQRPPSSVRGAESIRSEKAHSLPEKLVEIHDGVREVIATLKPDLIAIEQLFSHYKRPRTAILMGHARGVICLAAAAAHLPIEHYAATHVKKTLTGSGRRHEGTGPTGDLPGILTCLNHPSHTDVADAMAIALCHVFMAGNLNIRYLFVDHTHQRKTDQCPR